MRIAFRCDASAEIGSGHLMRCLTLADELKRRGAGCIFLGAHSTADWKQTVEARGHSFVTLALSQENQPEAQSEPLPHCHWLPWGQLADAEACVAAIAGPVDWLVVDHYALDDRWEKKLRPKTDRIMVIDDLADRSHDCDLLLDHNAGRISHNPYHLLTPAGCKHVIGPYYALINQAFSKERSDAEPSPRGLALRVLIFLGGGANEDLTHLAINAVLAGAAGDVEIDVVQRQSVQSPSIVQGPNERKIAVRFHSGLDANEMALLCKLASIAVGAGGVSALERCASGLPSLTLCLAANQREGVRALHELGGALDMGQANADGFQQISKAIDALARDSSRRSAIGTRARTLVDGCGTIRIAEIMTGKKSPVVLRKATMADAKLLFGWRNDPATRSISHSQEEIPYDAHVQWLDRTLQQQDRLVFIAEVGGVPAGTVRYAINGEIAVVSIAMDPAFRGKGYGTDVLAVGSLGLISHAADVRTIEASILRQNTASIILFEHAGYAVTSNAADQLICKKSV